MAIEGKANIDTLLIAAEVIERDHVKGVHFQSKDHLFQRDSLIQNAQRRFSTAYSAPITSSLNLHSASISPSLSPTSSALSSKRNWLTSDLITSSVSSCIPPVSQPPVNFPIIPDVVTLSDLQNILSAATGANIARSLDGSRSGTNNGSSTLPTNSNKPASPGLYSEGPDTWQGRRVSSPSKSAVSSTQTSSVTSAMADSVGMPHRQLRTALLSERLGGIKTQRAFGDVNPFFLQPDFLAQAAELVQLEPTSVMTSPEKTAPRLPAKKRKFDWGERSNGGDSSLQTSSQTSQQQIPASLIVDKPAQLEPARRSSVCAMADSSGLTGAGESAFPYPRGAPIKQRKLSYNDLSFSSTDVPAGFGSLRAPPNVTAYSSRIDDKHGRRHHDVCVCGGLGADTNDDDDDTAPARRSSLVVDVNNNASTSGPLSAASSSTSSGTNRMRSPPSGGGNVSGSISGGAVRWKGEFPSPSPSQPQRYHPSHHSEAGRRYSVFGAPPNLSNSLAAHQAVSATAAALRRHSSVMPALFTSSAASTMSPPNTNAFNTSTALLQLRQQHHIQSLGFDSVKSFTRPPIPSAKSTASEESTVPGSYDVPSAAAVAAALSAGVRPLSAPDEQIASGGWASPLKAERSCVRSAVSPTLSPLPEVPSVSTRERQRRMSHVPVLGAILSSSANDPNPTVPSDTPYSQVQGYTSGVPHGRKRSPDSLFPLSNKSANNFGGAVLLTGNPGDKSTFELSSGSGGFPLLLVSAPTSASAAEFAAATAMASGIPASSLIPVPVQIVPNSTSPTNPNFSEEPGVALVSKTTNEADLRLVFPLVPTPASDGQMGGCALGFPVLVPSRPPTQCHLPNSN
ncbi:hypothetical protein Aperf_G00000065068 [Anoplocephala perfoliata]